MAANIDEIIGYVDDEKTVDGCFALMRQLRPHLSGPEEFLARWRRQAGDGYRLVAVHRDGRPAALAGFRVQENLMHGRHLYVDDLVTDEAQRSAGLGERLMSHLLSIGREQGCARLVLDTALSNVLGHRFYYRQGLLASALRFYVPLN
jgi:ribosomal protein S18 acetylase RimI-like enzyme